MRRLLLVGVVLVALASCSGAQSEEPMKIGELAEKIGCQDFHSSSRELFVAASGYCHGRRGIDAVATFNNDEARDNWMRFATGFGGGVCVVGHNWAVCGPSRSAVEQVGNQLGGEVRG